MPATFADAVFDSGLSYLTANGDRLDLCTTQPTTYAQATSTYSAGNAAVTIGSPSDRTGGGRKVTVGAVTNGTVTSATTVGFYAITDGTSQLLVTGPLSVSFALVSGYPFTTPAFDIGMPDPA